MDPAHERSHEESTDETILRLRAKAQGLVDDSARRLRESDAVMRQADRALEGSAPWRRKDVEAVASRRRLRLGS